MELKNNFAIKCDTLEQKKHIRQILIDMGYIDDKVWNNGGVEEEDFIYWHVDESNMFNILIDCNPKNGIASYEYFCSEYNIKPIESIEPIEQPQQLDELIKEFQSEINKRGFEVEILFKSKTN